MKKIKKAGIVLLLYLLVASCGNSNSEHGSRSNSDSTISETENNNQNSKESDSSISKDATGTDDNSDEVSPITTPFLQINKSSDGALVIELTDDTIAEAIKPYHHDSEYRYNEDALYEIVLYSNALIGTDLSAVQSEWQTAFALLRVYSCGSSLQSYEVGADYARITEEWEYTADWTRGSFSTEGNTLILSFPGAKNVLDSVESYLCSKKDLSGDYYTLNACVTVKSSEIAPVNNNMIRVRFISNDKVYVTIYDDKLTENSTDVKYLIWFYNDKNDKEYCLSPQYNDAGDFMICHFMKNWEPFDYYVADNGYDKFPKDGDHPSWNGEAEVYDGHINMVFSYKDIKSLLSGFKYLDISKDTASHDEELLHTYSFNEVADLEDYKVEFEDEIEPVKAEFVRPYDAGIFEPITPYYFIVSFDYEFECSNTLYPSRIKSTNGTPFFPSPPFAEAWGFTPAPELERKSHAMVTFLESFDEFGTLVQSLERIEYETESDLMFSSIDPRRLTYPYMECGIDEPDINLVSEEYFDERHRELMEWSYPDIKYLGRFDNYRYYDLKDIYHSLSRYISCFGRGFITTEYAPLHEYDDNPGMQYSVSAFSSAIEGGGEFNFFAQEILDDGQYAFPVFYETGTFPENYDHTHLFTIYDNFGEIDGDTKAARTFEARGNRTITGYSTVGKLRRVLEFIENY